MPPRPSAHGKGLSVADIAAFSQGRGREFPETTVRERLIERALQGEMGIGWKEVRREYRLTPHDRIDVFVRWPDAIMIFEVKVIIHDDAVAQLRRYVEIARLVWPDLEVKGALYGCESRVTSTEFPVFVDPDADELLPTRPPKEHWWQRSGDF